ncbi:MAG: hypothetical protein E7Y34_02515, partial [Mycoplasma sp.]|nr:hypothetical protein [Mycoplasma sp.]
MVFQNIKLTLFAPLIGMGVVMFNTESVIMMAILKNTNTKNIDANFASPLMLFNDLKNSSDENKKNIWEDIKNIANSTKNIQNEDFFDFKKEAKSWLSNEQKIERLKNIFGKLKVWKLDLEKEVNIDKDNKLLGFLKDRIKQIASIETDYNIANTMLMGLEEKFRLKNEELHELANLGNWAEVRELEKIVKEIQDAINKEKQKIEQLKTQKEKLKRIIVKRYWDNRNDNNQEEAEGIDRDEAEGINNSIKQTIYYNLLSTF